MVFKNDDHLHRKRLRNHDNDDEKVVVYNSV